VALEEVVAEAEAVLKIFSIYKNATNCTPYR